VRWTPKLSENAVVALTIADHASDGTIGRTLKKHIQAASPEARVILPDGNAGFVAAM
jgi:hypothetical protein